ncbi:hypothetical protein CSUI_009425 [Cystoisospora suis]|uniref:Uncharacterized protein n=1 Tax=Cystoisospora suis TaxID=483139 RepID=A0A2C6KK59_9APIC|nr:hypothetical protein CSUI_009425 [Cystoisospora suis]
MQSPSFLANTCDGPSPRGARPLAQPPYFPLTRGKHCWVCCGAIPTRTTLWPAGDPQKPLMLELLPGCNTLTS